MQGKRFIAGLITIAMFLAGGLTACSDDDNPADGGNGGLGDSDQGTANALVYDLVFPLIQALNIGPYLDQLPTPGMISPSQCEALEICSNGEAVVCPGLGTITVEFTECNASGVLMDGLVSLEGDASAGTGTMSLTLDDYGIEGIVSYSNAEGCFSLGFTNVRVTRDNLEMTMSGSFSYCTPPITVNGTPVPDLVTMDIQIPGLNRSVDVIILEDPAGEVEVVVWNLGENVPILFCNGNILGSLSCFTGTN